MIKVMYNDNNDNFYKLPPIELVKKFMNLDLKCLNCGGVGHLYKMCKEPVMSYGIIAYNATIDKFLLIQRRHSIAYVDFIRGKYTFDDIKFLYMLLENMSCEEKENLLNKKFNDLWRELWIGTGTEEICEISYRSNELKKSKNMFELVSDGLNVNNQSYTLKSMIEEIASLPQKEIEWGFPKGRRSKNESDIQCAIREFKEETNMTVMNYINSERYIEEFIGSNGISYKYVYFIYVINGREKAEGAENTETTFNIAHIDKNNQEQIFEVGDIGWFSYEEAIKKISCRRKHGILRKIKDLQGF